MSQKNSELINRASSIQEPIWQSVAQQFSESSGAFLVSKDPRVSIADQDDLAALGSTRQIVIQFCFAHDPERPHVLVLDEGQFAGMLSAVTGALVSTVSEQMLTDQRPLLESIVQGICLGVGNVRQEAAAAVALTIRLTALLPPENLVRAGSLVKATGSLGLDSTKMEVAWLFEPDSLDAMISGKKAFGGRASLNEVGASGAPAEDASLQILMDIPLEISVELGRVKMVVRDVLELGAGSIVEIDKAAGEPVDVLVNGRHVARGEVVVIEDNFGVRITEILNPAERLAKLNEAA